MQDCPSGKYRINKLDLLYLDVEGHEGSILIGLDYSLIRPKVIIFEHIHLGENLFPLLLHLESHGYVIQTLGNDSVAVLIE